MAHTVTIRPRSWALVTRSLILIALSVRMALYELTKTLEGISSSDAWLAVGASMLSAVVGLVFLAWAARLKPTMLSRLAVFGWGASGALIFAGYGNTVIDSAVAASNLSDDAVDAVTSVVTGPLVEEISKGIGVLTLVLATRKVLDRPAQGGVLGALIDLGFAWGEDVGYYVSALEDRMGGLWQSFLARTLLSAHGHAIFTDMFGYALTWAVLRAQNVPVGLLATAGGFVAALAPYAQANDIGFLTPEDSWNLTYGAIEVPVLVVSVALPVWGLRRHRSTLEV